MKQYVESLQEALAREVEKHECLWEWHSTYWQTSCGHRTDNFNSGRCPYCYQTLVQTPTVHPLLIDLPKLEFNTEKAIAEAIMDALKMHEESGDGETGQYSKTMEECLLRTCAIHSLTGNMWALLNLAMHWVNDIQCWCDDIMAGRDVMDSYIKPEIDLCPTCTFDFGEECRDSEYGKGGNIVKCDMYRKNLCQSCAFSFGDCNSDPVFPKDDDNVLECTTYKRA